MTMKETMDQLTKGINEDSEYAWAWHCNIAMATYDEGCLSLPKANRAAARFMKNAFGVDMTKHEYFADTQKDWSDPEFLLSENFADFYKGELFK